MQPSLRAQSQQVPDIMPIHELRSSPTTASNARQQVWGLSSFASSHADLLAGSASGIANVFTGYPFDTLKVRMQSSPGTYASSWSCMRHILRTEGVPGLFRGAATPLAGGAVEAGINYMVYCRILDALAATSSTPWHARRGGSQQATPSFGSTGAAAATREPPLYHVAIAGAAAGAVLSCVLGPTELIKCRLQAAPLSTAHHLTAGACVRGLLAAEGVRGLARGLGATIAREVPGNSIFFTVYEGLRRLVQPPSPCARPAGEVPAAPATVSSSATATHSHAQQQHCAHDVGPLRQHPSDADPLHPQHHLLAHLPSTRHPLPHMHGSQDPCSSTPGTYARPAPAASHTIPSTATSSKADLGASWAGAAQQAGVSIVCGGLAGSAMWLVVLPLDTAKTRIQVAAPGSAWDVGMRAHLKMLWREGGVRALWTGCWPTMIHAFPSNAAQWLAWEYCKQALS